MVMYTITLLLVPFLAHGFRSSGSGLPRSVNAEEMGKMLMLAREALARAPAAGESSTAEEMGKMTPDDGQVEVAESNLAAWACIKLCSMRGAQCCADKYATNFISLVPSGSGMTCESIEIVGLPSFLMPPGDCRAYGQEFHGQFRADSAIEDSAREDSDGQYIIGQIELELPWVMRFSATRNDYEYLNLQTDVIVNYPPVLASEPEPTPQVPASIPSATCQQLCGMNPLNKLVCCADQTRVFYNTLVSNADVLGCSAVTRNGLPTFVMSAAECRDYNQNFRGQFTQYEHPNHTFSDGLDRDWLPWVRLYDVGTRSFFNYNLDTKESTYRSPLAPAVGMQPLTVKQADWKGECKGPITYGTSWFKKLARKVGNPARFAAKLAKASACFFSRTDMLRRKCSGTSYGVMTTSALDVALVAQRIASQSNTHAIANYLAQKGAWSAWVWTGVDEDKLYCGTWVAKWYEGHHQVRHTCRQKRGPVYAEVCDTSLFGWHPLSSRALRIAVMVICGQASIAVSTSSPLTADGQLAADLAIKSLEHLREVLNERYVSDLCSRLSTSLRKTYATDQVTPLPDLFGAVIAEQWPLLGGEEDEAEPDPASQLFQVSVFKGAGFFEKMTAWAEGMADREKWEQWTSQQAQKTWSDWVNSMCHAIRLPFKYLGKVVMKLAAPPAFALQGAYQCITAKKRHPARFLNIENNDIACWSKDIGVIKGGHQTGLVVVKSALSGCGHLYPILESFGGTSLSVFGVAVAGLTSLFDFCHVFAQLAKIRLAQSLEERNFAVCEYRKAGADFAIGLILGGLSIAVTIGSFGGFLPVSIAASVFWYTLVALRNNQDSFFNLTGIKLRLDPCSTLKAAFEAATAGINTLPELAAGPADLPEEYMSVARNMDLHNY